MKIKEKCRKNIIANNCIWKKKNLIRPINVPAGKFAAKSLEAAKFHGSSSPPSSSVSSVVPSFPDFSFFSFPIGVISFLISVIRGSLPSLLLLLLFSHRCHLLPHQCHPWFPPFLTSPSSLFPSVSSPYQCHRWFPLLLLRSNNVDKDQFKVETASQFRMWILVRLNVNQSINQMKKQ